MAKTIVKEIIIGLLLCLAILLVLAVLMYSYIPNNKVIPEPISYTAPESVKKTLEEAELDSSQVVLTYEVNSSDLSTAQRTNEYNPGKVNPFSSYKIETTEDGTTSTTGGTTNNASSGTTTGTGTTSGTTSNSTSANTSTGGGTYFKDKGTK